MTSSLGWRLAATYAVLLASSTVATALAVLNSGSQNLIAKLVFLTAVIMTFGVILAFSLARSATAPLDRLTRSARLLAGGAVVQPEPSRTAAGTLEKTFNEMAEHVTARIQNLEDTRLRLQALLAASNDAILALDGNGSVRYLNRAARRRYGNVSGRPIAEVVRDPSFTALLRRNLAGSHSREAVDSDAAAVLLHAIDDDSWLQAAVSPIDAGGEWSLAVVLRDVSEARRAETARRDFVANVSHELRTPLAGIKAVIETLQDGGLDDRTIALDFLNQAEGQTDRLVQLVDELLSLARIESGSPP